ncbi:NAD(+) diphosphatase [Veronia nyctiphanis]|uniref:NAD(+) diphosphatase n=2 Tax=Veronia nyctiphanis TaxID=1278244 RepID=A0A4Q0YNT3_9GAMM|nr:NAD(+) diphosphatase [Veronia nyctiphanis]
MQMYSGMPLNRQSKERKNDNWLRRRLSDTNALFIAVKEGQVLATGEGELNTFLLHAKDLFELALSQLVFLGEDENGAPYFAIDCWELSPFEEQHLSSMGKWTEVRNAKRMVSNEVAAILAFAKALCYWHQENGYCGKCGHPSTLEEGGHMRRCSNSSCNKPTFPRTDPAVIMLVEKTFEDGVTRCLLGRQAKWPKGRYSTLAGFVDPGETLEEAVIREVYEESSIHCTDATYVASQPWPFPSSLMLGFIATATTEAIDTTKDELENARWYSRDELDTVEATGTLIMPPKDSISYFLISSWRRGDIGTL